MFDLEVLCPHCEEKFKLNRIGLEIKESIRCPHCRRVIKLDGADLEKKAIQMDHDFVGGFCSTDRYRFPEKGLGYDENRGQV